MIVRASAGVVRWICSSSLTGRMAKSRDCGQERRRGDAREEHEYALVNPERTLLVAGRGADGHRVLGRIRVAEVGGRQVQGDGREDEPLAVHLLPPAQEENRQLNERHGQGDELAVDLGGEGSGDTLHRKMRHACVHQRRAPGGEVTERRPRPAAAPSPRPALRVQVLSSSTIRDTSPEKSSSERSRSS